MTAGDVCVPVVRPTTLVAMTASAVGKAPRHGIQAGTLEEARELYGEPGRERPPGRHVTAGTIRAWVL